MKATIDFDTHLYRRLKAQAALRGRTVKDLVTEGVRRVLDEERPQAPEAEASGQDAWFGALRPYAVNARGEHDLEAIRRSITRARSGQGQAP